MRIQNAMQRAEGVQAALKSSTGNVSPTRSRAPVGATRDSVRFQGQQPPLASSLSTSSTEVQGYLNAFPQYGPPPLNTAFHANRRAVLLSKLPPNTTVIVPGASLQRRNGDVDYAFRQESNLYYLTGFDEPDAMAILSNVPGKPKFTLVVPPRDQAKETWTGKRSGTTGALQIYKADQAFENTDIKAILKQQVAQNKNLLVLPSVANENFNKSIYQTMLKSSPWGNRIRLYINELKRLFKLSVNNDKQNAATHAVEAMRLVKTPYEIALLQRAISISAQGHMNAMKKMKLTAEEAAQPGSTHAAGRNEGEVQAQVEYDFRRHGAVRQGYDTIAGGGVNACVLHYNTNRQYAKPGDLELVDAGAEYGYYTADVTRTWPISGKYTPQQKAIYDLVLKAQEAGIQMTRPGVSMAQIHKACTQIVNEGLVELEILKPGAKPDAYRPYFMHGTSHMLGMDVHDVPSPGTGIDGRPVPAPKTGGQALQPGNVFTVEPGIYIDPALAKRNGVDPQWWGIGVRIEDDILVTEKGFENLSAEIPRKPEEIEALMA